MDHRQERVQLFADMHSSARIKANKSQEYMALELGVSKRTVQNWEKGISSPSFFQSLEWFRILNTNPFPQYFKFVNTDFNKNIKYESDEEVNNAFEILCKNMAPSSKRAILYVFTGRHGSSPSAILELALAYLHLPLKSRSSHTSTVIHDYVMEDKTGNINDSDAKPNMEILNYAFKKANESVLKNLESYNDV